MLEAFFALGLYEEINRPVEQVARASAQQAELMAPRIDDFADPVKLFVLTRAVSGVIRAAILEASPFIGSAALEEEVVALIMGYDAHAQRALAATSTPGTA